MARNLHALMELHGYKQEPLAEKAGVSQRTIGNMLDPEGPATRIDNVDAVAAVFGLDGWHLIMPNLIEDLIDGSSGIAETIRNYLQASEDGKRHILRIAEREAEYNAPPPRKPAA